MLQKFSLYILQKTTFTNNDSVIYNAKVKVSVKYGNYNYTDRVLPLIYLKHKKDLIDFFQLIVFDTDCGNNLFSQKRYMDNKPSS